MVVGLEPALRGRPATEPFTLASIVMLFGDPATFAVECHHDPLPNETRRVFGRMCIWLGGESHGDIDEPACMLNVTEGFVECLLARLDSLEDDFLNNLGDREAFDFLNRALYLDDERPDEQIRMDAERFFNFSFLTSAGESFDHTKSFVIGYGNSLRILLEDDVNGFTAVRVPNDQVVSSLQEFLHWIAEEGKNAG